MADLRVPGAVYRFALAPDVTDHPTEAGWPTPYDHHRGFGVTYIYTNITPELRRDIIAWVRLCAEGIVGHDSRGDRDARAALRWANNQTP